MTITRDTMVAIRADLETMLQSISEKHGLKIKVGNGKYDHSNGSFVLNISTFEGGEEITKYSESFRLNSKLYGVPASALFSEITVNGEKYKLIGLNIRCSKLPFIAKCGEKSYKLSTTTVQNALKA